ncbi:MAG: hypothetical protein NTY53_20060, partial [Kiritimatiellaeota bacterium]|nr:hypothetical protein [Kiritimatiellota bacterium]
AVAAQFDYQQPYKRMLWAYRPRWGGSHELMFAFGKACFETRRFDTAVPVYFVIACRNIASELPDCRPFYRQPGIAKPLLELGQALLKEPRHAYEREMRLSHLALYAWLAGDYELAAKTLAQIGDKMHPQTVDNLKRYYQGDEALLRYEVAIYSSGARADFEKGEEQARTGDLISARAAYETALSKVTNTWAREAITARLGVLDIEQHLAAGEGTKLSADPTLAQWIPRSGTWQALPDGTLVNQGEGLRGILLHRARIGPDFELRGEFEFKDPKRGGQNIGIAIGWNLQEEDAWTMCRIGQVSSEAPTACLIDGNHSTPKEPGMKINLQPKNKFRLRCCDHQLTLEVNG